MADSEENTSAQASHGVYCLGNDESLDWLIALFESLRLVEPDLRLVVIPFDNRITHLSRLAPKYNFEIYQDETLLQLEEMARTHLRKGEKAAKVFRKFSTFWGPLEHFLFLDADIVVLDRIDALFQHYFRSDVQFVYQDIYLPMAYKPGPWCDGMVAQYGSRGFNSGHFLSSRGAITLEQFCSLAKQASVVQEHFASAYEQSFLNYCVDVLRLRQAMFSELIPTLSPSVWAGHKGIGRVGKCYEWTDSFSGSVHLPFLHWAGFHWGRGMPYRQIFLHYRLRGQSWRERVDFLRRFLRR